jgi:hypothetical protein
MLDVIPDLSTWKSLDNCQYICYRPYYDWHYPPRMCAQMSVTLNVCRIIIHYFQGLFQLLETDVTIRCRKEDVDLVKVCCNFVQCHQKQSILVVIHSATQVGNFGQSCTLV